MSSEIQFKSEMDVALIDSMGDDRAIAAAAWVSTGAKIMGPSDQRVASLINFLMRDRHGTPFEHNSLTFRISAPLFVFYEFHRHRVGWSYNEESARYRELDPVFYVPRPNRALRQVGKPGAYTFELGSEDQVFTAGLEHRHNARESWDSYQFMLDQGIAREVARNVLPVSIYKTMYATCNVRSLFSFLTLRYAHHLSKVPTFPLAEIEEVAKGMEELARPLFPLAFEAFDKHGRVSP